MRVDVGDVDVDVDVDSFKQSAPSLLFRTLGYKALIHRIQQ